MKRRLDIVLDRVRQSHLVPYFGFVQGHSPMTLEELSQLEKLVAVDAPEVVAKFESEFAKLVGDGAAISYAAGRMSFYDLMRNCGIQNGDEVILLGATCAVMVNAVLRTGAIPVFSDIDPNTFGSAANSIEARITPKTKMIVAQHSFGIPCNIEAIAELAKSKNVFLLEDCALALGSKIGGVVVGNFGDAALFSTDHSKPLNTLTGGLVYTRNTELARRLRNSHAACLELPPSKQKALWQRFLLEQRFCEPSRYGRMGLIDLLDTIKKKLFRMQMPFLSDDFGAAPIATYPYPAKLPAFLAALGLIEIKRWPTVASERKALLQMLLTAFGDSRVNGYLPSAYRNKRLEIVPLRFAWFQADGTLIRESIKQFVHVPWTWFMQPIIATSEPLENLGYRAGSCPISERIGPGMVNLPCNISLAYHDKFVKLCKEAIA